MSRVAITGALSYTGRYLTRLLLDTTPVSSIVSFSSRTNPIASNNITAADLAKIQTTPLTFDDLDNVKRQLEGVDVFYCTYWIRFEADGDTQRRTLHRQLASEAQPQRFEHDHAQHQRTDQRAQQAVVDLSEHERAERHASSDRQEQAPQLGPVCAAPVVGHGDHIADHQEQHQRAD